MNLFYEDTKTNLIHFHNTQGKPPPDLTESSINLHNVTIESSHYTKHLGVMIHQSLNFKEHFQQVQKSIHNITRNLFRLKYNAYDLYPSVCHLLITANIIPTILYASTIYWKGEDTTISNLQPIYNRVIR